MNGGSDILHAQTRINLHRIAAHVLGRRRYQATGRFGLRATPAGFGTPAFGEPLEVIRTSGTNLVHEVGSDTRMVPMSGATLRTLASFVGADIDDDFSVGADTPPAGDPDDPIGLDTSTVRGLAEWFGLGWIVLDTYVAGTGSGADAAAVQLWPEHFDAGTSVILPGGRHVNIGFSAGDGFEAEPYAYFGPWDAARPGDRSYWNAPFGAFLRRDQILASVDPVRFAMEFLDEGTRLITEA